MVSVTHAAHRIEVTAESLQEDLARLEAQKQALERELAAVVAHLGSVQRALSVLQALLSPAESDSSGAVGTTVAEAAVPAESGPEQPETDPVAAAAARTHEVPQPAPEARDASSKSSQVAGELKKYGKLTEQILDYFAGVGDADVRARDVATALGRATDSGSINAVRSTLDRLVATSRIRRTGRGMYRAR